MKTANFRISNSTRNIILTILSALAVEYGQVYFAIMQTKELLKVVENTLAA